MAPKPTFSPAEFQPLSMAASGLLEWLSLPAAASSRAQDAA